MFDEVIKQLEEDKEYSKKEKRMVYDDDGERSYWEGYIAALTLAIGLVKDAERKAGKTVVSG